MVQSFVRTVRAWQKHVQAFLLASTIGAAVLVPCASLAQNLGTTPATGQAVQGQTASQPEGAFLNAVNWLRGNGHADEHVWLRRQPNQSDRRGPRAFCSNSQSRAASPMGHARGERPWFLKCFGFVGTDYAFCGGEFVKRHIIEIGGVIALSLAAYLSCSIASSLPVLSLVGPGSGSDATFSDLSPDWIIFPTWRLKWPEFRTFCVGLCTDEELMR